MRSDDVAQSEAGVDAELSLTPPAPPTNIHHRPYCFLLIRPGDSGCSVCAAVAFGIAIPVISSPALYWHRAQRARSPLSRQEVRHGRQATNLGSAPRRRQ